MKQGEVLNRVMMLVLFGAVLLYLGVTVWKGLTDPYTLATCYATTVEETMEVTGFLVREEQVIQGGGAAVVEQLYNEGEKVASGATVALLYSSADAAQRQAQLQTLEEERTQLQYALTATNTVSDNARLNEDIIDAIVDLRSSAANGDLTRLEDQTLELRSLIYQRSSAYEGGDTAALQSQLDSVNAQISALTTQAGADTTRVTVSQPGTFSGLVDGYESILTPEAVEAMTPAQLKAVGTQTVTAQSGAVGKLITDATWRFACVLTEEEANRLTEDKSVEVRFSRDWSGEVDMKVERVGAPVDGECVVIFSTDRFLSETTLLRRQTVELVFRSQEGLRVPSGAIRTLEQTVTDEDGNESTVQTVGVYAVVGMQYEFKPVEILARRDDYCVVAPVEDSSSAKTILRAGDQVVIAGDEIFDGMVVD